MVDHAIILAREYLESGDGGDVVQIWRMFRMSENTKRSCSMSQTRRSMNIGRSLPITYGLA